MKVHTEEAFEQLIVEHGKPMIYGTESNKGLRVKPGTFEIETVTIGENGAFDAIDKEAVFVDNTTASAFVARELADEAESRGFSFLDAPVSGGQAGAETGALTVMDVKDKYSRQ